MLVGARCCEGEVEPHVRPYIVLRHAWDPIRGEYLEISKMTPGTPGLAYKGERADPGDCHLVETFQ